MLLAVFAVLAQGSPQLDTVRVASGLSLPLFACAPPGDLARLFIVEQRAGTAGRIRVLDLATGILDSTSYLSIDPVSTGNEQGLLGLAFHPDFADNGFFYVDYTDSTGTTVVARYQANAPFMTSATADPLSAQQVISIAQPYPNHNGGWIGFGPDGYLYVATGDGGFSYDPANHAQNQDSLLGKILRLDVDGDDFPADPTRNYAIPPTNPWAGTAPGADEVWQLGLRNPWRIGFDRATGDLWIGDVGQYAVEEIDVLPAGVGGLNLGWRCTEGDSCTGFSGCVCNGPALTRPVHTYSHALGCAVMGGYVYRGSAICGLPGTYFFADYCSNQIWSFRATGGVVSEFKTRTTELAPGGGLSIQNITSFGEDASGELYLCAQGGDVYKIVPSAESQDADLDGIPDECEPAILGFCDPGVHGVIGCPCGNAPAIPGRGCDNFGSHTGGASLEGSGEPSLASDTLVLVARDENAAALTIFWTGSSLIAPPGVAHGAGIRCVSALDRLYAGVAVGGRIARPASGDPSVSAQSARSGAPISPGQSRFYFTVYRDPSAAAACGSSAVEVNLSAAVSVRWGP
jgi:glucose/arabinose dehydrogenase